MAATACSGPAGTPPISTPQSHSQNQPYTASAFDAQRHASIAGATKLPMPSIPAGSRHLLFKQVDASTFVGNILLVSELATGAYDIIVPGVKPKLQQQFCCGYLPSGVDLSPAIQTIAFADLGGYVYLLGASQAVIQTGPYPLGISYDRSGDLFIANAGCDYYVTGCTGTPGNIQMVPAGSTTPQTIHGGPSLPIYVKVDHRGLLWADGFDNNYNPVVGYFSHGHFVKVPLPVAFPAGMDFDDMGDLVIADLFGAQNGTAIADVFPWGSTTPSSQITLQNDGTYLYPIALGSLRQRVYSSNLNDGGLNAYGFPAGPEIWSYSMSPSVGIRAFGI